MSNWTEAIKKLITEGGCTDEEVEKLILFREQVQKQRKKEREEEFEAKSDQGAYLHGDPTTLLRHTSNHDYEPAYRDFPYMGGDFGLQLIGESGKGVAFCSFNLTEQKNDGLVMHVVDLPRRNEKPTVYRRNSQAVDQPHSISDNERQSLIQGLQTVAQDLGCVRIETVSALEKEHELFGKDLKRQRGVIDYSALACGFQYDHATRNLVLPLK